MRVLTFLALLLSSAIIAGVYGALYDQLTYSISHEFFTVFRFKTFKVDYDLSDRVKVAIMGFKNSWNVGLLIGLILSLSGLIHSSNRKMFLYTIHAFLIVLGFAFILALIGLLAGPSSNTVPISDTIIDKAGYTTIERMNNFSYVGAVVGMFVGIFYQLYRKKKEETLHRKEMIL